MPVTTRSTCTSSSGRSKTTTQHRTTCQVPCVLGRTTLHPPSAPTHNPVRVCARVCVCIPKCGCGMFRFRFAHKINARAPPLLPACAHPNHSEPVRLAICESASTRVCEVSAYVWHVWVVFRSVVVVGVGVARTNGGNIDDAVEDTQRTYARRMLLDMCRTQKVRACAQACVYMCAPITWARRTDSISYACAVDARRAMRKI